MCLCFCSGAEDTPVQPTEGGFGAPGSAHQSSSAGQMSAHHLAILLLEKQLSLVDKLIYLVDMLISGELGI